MVGPLLGLLLILPIVVVNRILPFATQFRLQTLILALEGSPVDTSAIKRTDRVLKALEIAQQKPWGIGWNGSGWTHNDLVQIAANQGVLAVFVFICGYIYALFRLGKHLFQSRLQNKLSEELAGALLISFIGAGVVLAAQGVQVLPQTIIPVWLIWILVEVWLRQQEHTQDLPVQ
jgi:O-antigen ligase